MQLFVCSDIHGDRHALELALAAYERSEAEYLVILGDLLNHGPRNPLPRAYDPMTVADRLNVHAQRIIAVRGNCDSEVDQALCQFPMMSEYNQLIIGKRRAFICHGHTFNPSQRPPLATGDLFVSGHTHIPKAECHENNYLFNPGSVAIPRGEWPTSYGTISDQGLFVYDLNNHQPLLECLFEN
jgi:putative phosphoesterase